MNENTEQTIEILEYAVQLAKAVNRVDSAFVVDLMGFDPEEASPLDYVTAARMVYADKRLADALKDAAGERSDGQQTPEAPTLVQVDVLRSRYMDGTASFLGTVNGVRYFRTPYHAENALETSTSNFAGFWCADCDGPHLLERM